MAFGFVQRERMGQPEYGLARLKSCVYESVVERASFVAVGDGLGDDADVGDAGNAELIDNSGEDPKRNGLIGAEEDGFVGTFELFFDARGKLVDVDGIVADVDELIFVDGDDDFLLVDFLDGVGFGDVDFDAGLEDRCGDHEDDEEDEDDVDERNHVDVGERGLGGFA
jgi:hypothetical protein